MWSDNVKMATIEFIVITKYKNKWALSKFFPVITEKLKSKEEMKIILSLWLNRRGFGEQIEDNDFDWIPNMKSPINMANRYQNLDAEII